ESLRAKVARIIIHDIHDNTFYAKVVLETGNGVLEIDARPSDSIALALRTNSPIFVSERIILEETVVDKSAEEQDLKKFKKYIENLKPSDFLRGKDDKK
ncbi:MAG: bifunctional nuclease family protein, partial [Armatimonadetes bacterium]|nr:bifunctional nuclease family protein [Armatimonadota bacterium]